ncbi:hypothetical protein QVD17_35873 [Tagetes erecta]|uniref:Uncharacterized protein n=1 Tax=Tagetes erecta TaxID=13708 RepID=A0AAD8JV75_TARER|nr:hypothetical protein QVD17_35873 [Tagetes erecta]
MEENKSHITSVRPPTVQSVLNTCQVESSGSSLHGFVALADSFGCCWIVGITSGFECIVLGMESWNLLLPARVDKEKKLESLEENIVAGDATIISKELLTGPKVVIVPPTSPNPVAADSIEGRSTLHQYFKLFHENYVEYAHKEGIMKKEAVFSVNCSHTSFEDKVLYVGVNKVQLSRRISGACLIERRMCWCCTKWSSSVRIERIRELDAITLLSLAHAFIFLDALYAQDLEPSREVT